MNFTADIATRLLWKNYDFSREARDQIVRLRAQLHSIRMERDQARQEVCARTVSEQAIIGCDQQTPQAVAESRGWDCFEEGSE